MLTANSSHIISSTVKSAFREGSASLNSPLIRLRKEPVSPVQNSTALNVRPIQSEQELDAVYRLTYECYIARGYCRPQPDNRLIHYPHLDRITNTTVIVALINNEVIGTNSYTFDGPKGLHVDADFKAECDIIRAEGRKLASSWRIATCSRFRNQNKLVMSLIHETAWRSFGAGMETCVFTFHPRHERIYQRLLNMKTVARKDRISELLDAPAVFMRLDVESCPERWKVKPTWNA